MKTDFYDIESLENLFTLANYKADENCIDMYYLLDDNAILEGHDVDKDALLADVKQRIYDNNKNFRGEVNLLDLHEEEVAKMLAKTFGLSTAMYINNPKNKSNYDSAYRLVCDTDPEYDENVHPYLIGYNSYNYDTTMLALFFFDTFKLNSGKPAVFTPVKAKTMRQYNNELFNNYRNCMPDRLKVDYDMSESENQAQPLLVKFTKSDFKDPKNIIRKNMLMSGRHIDAARLNEKQSKVALKRLLGMLGYQILESDKLKQDQDHIENYDQFLDLIAYNCSDVVNLEKLFEHKAYKSAFTLKKQLLKTYPELIYSEDPNNAYKPLISCETVRSDRLVIDSSSAQFATKSLCPYNHLHDYDTVSFDYPAKEIAEQLGIKRVNVLEEARNFFYNNFPQPELRERFDEIYNYYKQIEGKNFNESKNYLIDHGVTDLDVDDPHEFLDEELRPWKLSKIPAPNTCLFYYNKDGSPSSCFVNFSTGGIHGAEYNKELFEADLRQYEEDMKTWQDKCDLFDKVAAIYPNPWNLKENKGVTIDGIKYKPSDFLEPKPTPTTAKYKKKPDPPKKPQLFKKSQKKDADANESWNLDKRYAYTSADPTQHEDFTSYYPNMLRMMRAFWNKGLGYDRYGEIFDDKTKYGKMMKDEKYTKDERELYSVMRNGTKLILNSASGAGDANFESNVRMNNKIISMRIIGQLFTWRIGQAQTLEGAKITSTNTDGLYSAGLEADINNAILERESKAINVEIEPEPIYLISKDSNNRAEIEIENGDLGKVAGANGGTLSCRKGPTPTQSLAHPAIIDWALTEYLVLASSKYKGITLDAPFNEDLGRNILTVARNKFNDDVHTLIMFQNVIASSPGSIRYVFATTDADPNHPIPLQHYNRCFIVKDGTPDSKHLQVAAAKVITDAMKTKRVKNGDRPQQHDPIAKEILGINGVDVNALPVDKEATVNKITGIETSWYIAIDNRDLHMLEQSEIDKLLDSLDYEKYLLLLHDSFENNWRNTTVEWELYEKEQKAQKTAEAKAAKTKTASADNDTTSVSASVPEPEPIPAPEPETPVMQLAPNNMLTMQALDGTTVEIEGNNDIIQLNKTILTPKDLDTGINCLQSYGIRYDMANMALQNLLKRMLKTDVQIKPSDR